MSAIGDLAKMVNRLENLTKDDGYGGITKARGIESEYRHRAASIKISPPGYEHTASEREKADKEAAEALKIQFIAQYQAEGRGMATKALEAVSAEIHQIRLKMPCVVAAAYAEAYQIVNGLEREISERRAE